MRLGSVSDLAAFMTLSTIVAIELLAVACLEDFAGFADFGGVAALAAALVVPFAGLRVLANANLGASMADLVILGIADPMSVP